MLNIAVPTKSAPGRMVKGALIEIGCCRFRHIFGVEVGQARLRCAVPAAQRWWARFALPTLQWLPLLLALNVGAAHAHAFLDHADPRVGNTVKGSPRTVSLWFTQNLESGFSTIEVLDSNGARMNAANASVDANERKLLRVPLKVLPTGTYTVKWRVLSVDTHTTEGNFTFHVAP